ncbi:transcription antitermination factor NusB [Lutibacter sp. B2]|nr:transcription antitermination factor NusB [Lutibacter sp. B2]
MLRKMAREIAMQLIFQMEVHKDFSNDIINKFINNIPEGDKQITYIREVATTFIENKDNVDRMIEDKSRGWKIDRIAKVDLSILRVSITEIFHMTEIPTNVSVNEAIELAKLFSTADSSSFINGILGSILEKN